MTRTVSCRQPESAGPLRRVRRNGPAFRSRPSTCRRPIRPRPRAARGARVRCRRWCNWLEFVVGARHPFFDLAATLSCRGRRTNRRPSPRCSSLKSSKSFPRRSRLPRVTSIPPDRGHRLARPAARWRSHARRIPRHEPPSRRRHRLGGIEVDRLQLGIKLTRVAASLPIAACRQALRPKHICAAR